MEEDEEICRVCRSTASPDKPLFHPCICTGSIRHVHQECLMQWLQHSRKEYCELCNYKYSFKPIYSPDMPTRLPLRDLFFGLLKSIGSAVKCWIHYTLVAVAWLGIVPLTASRIYNCVFAGSVSALASLPMDMLSTQNVTIDTVRGCAIVTCTLSAFIALIWLRVQVLNEELPAWLAHRLEEHPQPEVNNNQHENELQEAPDVNEAENANDDPEVNWAEMERDVEDPSWERIMGLDGSFLFVEHVFWVIALNTLFILVFAFCPYHLGHFFLLFVDLHSYAKATKFEGVLTALCGYVLVAFAFLLCNIVLQICRFYWSGRIFGLCYIILKVGLLVLVEIGIFPLLCGIWLDICTLKIFNCTLEDRQNSYFSSPGIAIFLHWVIGMMFVYYFANFLMMAKEVLKPGALWFLRNLNDPEFNPIYEMIHLSIYKYCRRFLLSTMIFGSTVVFVAWLPGNILVYMVPDLVPFATTMNTSVIGEFCLQILVVQLTVPAVLEHKKSKACIKHMIVGLVYLFGSLLGVKSYFLYDNHLEQLDGLDTADRIGPAGVRRLEVNSNQSYVKPPFFALRIIFLLIFVAATFALTSFVIMVVPVSVGRSLTNIVFGSEFLQALFTNDPKLELHDTYNFLLGAICCWICIRLYWAFSIWLPYGWNTITERLIDGCFMFAKSLSLTFLFTVVLPLLIGALMDLIILIPLTVPLRRTPIFNIMHNWGAGFIAQLISLVIILVGPRNWLKNNIERAYEQGIRRLPLLEFVNETCMPVLFIVLLSLCLPYVVGHSIPILFDCDLATEYFFKWRTFPLLIFGISLTAICWYEVKQFYHLCDHIKNERYLIGKRLQDYNP